MRSSTSNGTPSLAAISFFGFHYSLRINSDMICGIGGNLVCLTSLRRVDINHRESFDGMIPFHNLDIGVDHSNKDGLML